ncbi:MAG: SRPBCC domain-containing protein [Bacteroidia bacterium]|nr:SRPBCC domain-containing protein [Bacteroidia bacterium]
MSQLVINTHMPNTDSYSHKEIVTEITIHAPASKVWEILTDFESYEDWNPFIVKSEGSLVLGESITNHMKLNDKINTFSPTITLVEEGKQFEWHGSSPLGMFNGNHYFILEALADGNCKLIHGERFSGWLRWLLMRQIGQETFSSFKSMNEALKARAEA